MSDGSFFETPITRRKLLRGVGLAAGGLIAGQVAAACGGGGGQSTSTGAAPTGGAAATGAAPSGGTITIGFVSPLTGPAAGFGEGDPYVISLAQQAFAKGLTVGGQRYDVKIVNKDSQSTPQRAAQVANDLIQGEKVDLLLATSTPEVVNPVSDAAEAAAVPCISTVVPWEAWYFGRGAKPNQPSPFKYTYHFSFGTQQFAEAYTGLWSQVPTNKRVGVMWPNDADGNAIRENLGPLLEKAGYKIYDPGAYQDGTTDYSSQIAFFKRNQCEIFNTFPIPPDFTTFWRQAAQQGYTGTVKIAQIAKTGLFPSQVTVLGPLGFGLASGAYWTPTFPYTSSLTGLSSKEIGDGYTQKSGRQWNQQLGASLALFDVAKAVLEASGNPKDKQAVADAMKNLEVETPVGRLKWGAGGPHNPVPNVVTTPIIGGQWVKQQGTFPVDFVLCEHTGDPNVPVAATLKPYNTYPR
jgi:branched-chain amino acid transport system substrate-binding protein